VSEITEALARPAVVGSLPATLRARRAFRQAAEKNRLAACAPQKQKIPARTQLAFMRVDALHLDLYDVDPTRAKQLRALLKAVNSRIEQLEDQHIALDQTLAREPISGVTEAVPTYRSLLVHYDPTQIDFDTLGKKLVELARRPVPPTQNTRRWRIPVVYGGEHGIDLEDVAKTLKTTPDDIVARHIAGDYRVAMIGFTPGWSYLSGLQDSLHLPRRQNPRLLTPAGTISIGGVQTGVQCLAGPSGWHLLGRTAVRTYQLHRDPIFLLEPGDRVTFSRVDAKTFAEQDRAAEHGEIVAELMAA